MYARLPRVALTLLAVLLLAAAAVHVATGETRKNVTGTVKSTTATELVVTVDGKDMKFVVNPTKGKGMTMMLGKPAVGAPVKVYYKPQPDGSLFATRVDTKVTSPPAKKSP